MNSKLLEQSLKKYFGKQKNIDYIMEKTNGPDQSIKIYQILCMLTSSQTENQPLSQSHSETQPNITQIISYIKNNQLLWSHPTFEEEKIKIEEENNFMVCPYELSEGVLKCRKCQSEKIYSFSKQTRSMDEPTTVFALCSKCGHKWCEGS